MLDLEVIDDADTAAAMLDPLRRQCLDALAEPGSASSLASALGLPRQKVNYHLRTLEERGLVSLVEERPRRGLTERILQASARSYLISPAVLDEIAPSPDRAHRLSAQYLLACTARAIREVADLARRAEAAGKTLPTLTINTDVCFASPADRAAFTEELTAAVRGLIATYHAEVPGGRWHRLLITAHPTPSEDPS